MSKIFTLPALLFFALNSVAMECVSPDGRKNIDFRDDYYAATIDQGPIGWCYAHAEAMLITHELQRKGLIDKSDNVSGTGISLRYNENLRPEVLAKITEIGPELEKISGLLNRTLKSRKVMEDQLRKEERNKNSDTTKIDFLKKNLEGNKNIFALLSDKINSLQEQFSEILENEGGYALQTLEKDGLNKLCLDSDIRSYVSYIEKKALNARIYNWSTKPEEERGRIDDVGVSNSTNDETYLGTISGALKISAKRESYPSQSIQCSMSKVFQNIFVNLNIDEIRGILFKSDIADPLKELHRRSCQRSYNYNVNVKRSSWKAMSSLPTIDEGLEKGHGVLMRYDGRIYDNPDFFSNPNLTHHDTDSKGNHASVIVGRRYNCDRNSFDYILKNSWGKKSCENKKSTLRRNFLARSKFPKKFSDQINKCMSTNGCYGKEPSFERRDCSDTCKDKGYSNFEKDSDSPFYQCEGEYFILPKDLVNRGTYGSAYISLTRDK